MGWAVNVTRMDGKCHVSSILVGNLGEGDCLVNISVDWKSVMKPDFK
jgi:hypothetical protein